MPSIATGDTPTEISIEVAEFLTRKFVEVNIALGNNGQMIKHKTMPRPLAEGKVYYFSQALPPDIVRAGFWGYTNNGWVYLGADHSVEAAYGGLAQVISIPLPDIDVNWQVVPFAEGSLPSPRLVTQDFDNNQLVVETEGIFRFGVAVALTHNEQPNGRVLNFRLRNPVTDVASDLISMGTGRDTAVSFFSISALLDTGEASPAGLGNNIQLEVRADTSDMKDIYEDVILTEATFNVNSVSERWG